jgi:hypothetical protein
LGYFLLRNNPDLASQLGLGHPAKRPPSTPAAPELPAEPEPVDVDGKLATRPALRLLLDALSVAAAVTPNKIDDVLLTLARQVIGDAKKEEPRS